MPSATYSLENDVSICICDIWKHNFLGSYASKELFVTICLSEAKVIQHL